MVEKPKLLLKKTLIKRAQESVGTGMFRNMYAIVDGKEVDLLEDGDKSCGVSVSAVLASLDLIDGPHAMVESTVRAMEASGWFAVPIEKAEAGDVILWHESKMGDLSEHRHKHLGIYLGEGRVISNSSETRSPREHDWEYEGRRKPVMAYRYNF